MSSGLETQLLKARAAGKRGDTAGAAQLYQAILRQFPGNARARAALAALHGTAEVAAAELAERYRQGALAEVVERGEALLADHPDALARVGASLLAAIGLPELVTTSEAEYEAVAGALATDPSRLAALRARLGEARRTAPLFDSRRYARDLEAGFAIAHQRHRDGQPPADIRIGDAARQSTILGS